MLRRPLRRRAGFSLVEVLVAIFILAAGLLALFTLFPLGAVQMGKALRDDRSQQTALQADGKIREWWRVRVVEGTPAVGDQYFMGLDEYYSSLNYFDDPDGAGPATSPTGLPPIGLANRVSYPVLFDPIGYVSYAGSLKQRSAAGFVSSAGPPLVGGIPRRTRLFGGVGSPLAAPTAFCTLPDDMEFAADGTPADRDGLGTNATGAPVFRAGRFNWAAVLQRPNNANRTTADLKILVFDQRAPGVNPTLPVNNELHYQLTATPGSTQLVLPAGNDVLGLRAGSWIMDGTINATAGIRNAQFYQVQNVDDTVAGQTTIELVTPIVRPRGEASAVNPYTAQIYLFRELIDVYDRPQLTPSGYAKQTP